MDTLDDFGRGGAVSLVGGAVGLRALFTPRRRRPSARWSFLRPTSANPNTRKAYARAVDGLAVLPKRAIMSRYVSVSDTEQWLEYRGCIKIKQAPIDANLSMERTCQGLLMSSDAR